MDIFVELKRRNVFRVGVAYLVTAWLLAQVADLALDNFDAPGWVMKTILLVLAIGFPMAIFFAWAFEKTPEGIKREKDVDRSRSITPRTGQKLDRGIITALGLAVIFLMYKVTVEDADLVPESASEPAVAESSQGHPKPEQTSIPSIAVLPFVDMSPDKDQEYFSDGIAEEILNVLAQVKQLQVAARTSAFQFKGKNQDIQDIATQLGVAWVLEGSVRKAGERVRVTAQLIKADNGFHAWSQTYDRDLTDVFAIQDEISLAIADALKVALDVSDDTGVRQGETRNLVAYEHYLMGRHLLNQRTKKSITESVEQFEKAIELDSSFALAYSDLALSKLLLSDAPTNYGDTPHEEALANARPIVEEALRLAPLRPEVLAAKGLLESHSGNNELALDFLDRSLAITPANGEAQNWRRMLLMGMRRFSDALDASYASVRYDPMSKIALTNHASVLTWFGRIEEATATANRLRALSLDWGEEALGYIAGRQGDEGRAAEHYFRVILVRDKVRGRLAQSLAQLGLFEEAVRVDPEDKFLAARAGGGLAQWLSLAKTSYQEKPENEFAIQRYADLLTQSGNSEQAFELYLELFRKNDESKNAFSPSEFIWAALAARSAGKLEWAARWRALAEESLSEGERSGLGEALGFQDFIRFAIASYDGDFDLMIRHARKMTNAGQWLVPDDYQDNELLAPYLHRPEFQELIAQWNQTQAEQRAYIANALCGDNPPLPDWEPAPETCAYASTENKGQATASN